MQPTEVDTIGITIIALRETMMEYFKGNVFDRMGYNDDICMMNVRTNTRFIYERNRVNAVQERIVQLKGVPLFVLRKQPDTVIFFMQSLVRSKQLRRVYTELKEFFERYLPAVQLKEYEGEPTNAHIDI